MGTGTSCNNDYYWGGRYQCVEYARRYLCERHRSGTGPTDCYMMPSLVAAFGDGRACRICDLQDPHLAVHYLYDGYVPQERGPLHRPLEVMGTDRRGPRARDR